MYVTYPFFGYDDSSLCYWRITRLKFEFTAFPTHHQISQLDTGSRGIIADHVYGPLTVPKKGYRFLKQKIPQK